MNHEVLETWKACRVLRSTLQLCVVISISYARVRLIYAAAYGCVLLGLRASEFVCLNRCRKQEVLEQTYVHCPKALKQLDDPRYESTPPIGINV